MYKWWAFAWFSVFVFLVVEIYYRGMEMWLMKILVVCAAGMSSSLLLNQMNRYSLENHLDWQIHSDSCFQIGSLGEQFDIALVAPQMAFRTQEIQTLLGIPCASIPSFDYATANIAHIAQLVAQLFKQRNK